MFEELAEAYVNGKADGGHFDLEQFGKAYFSESSMKQAFLAGIKAGKKITWHDLRKNPDDLPPRKGLETYSERLITDKGYSVYNFRKCRWYVDEPDCDCMVHRDVIAWCEIPKFEES